VTLVGPRLRTIEGVRILGPARDFTQVELSRTDGIALGLDLPMRKSGDLASAAPITVVGPHGSLTLSRGAIRSNRHIHMGPADAAKFGVKDNDVVRVRVPGEEGVVFENVQVRVKEGWLLTLHVDTDDANASNLFCNMKAYLLPAG
jgi:putative phosphotransacetylase